MVALSRGEIILRYSSLPFEANLDAFDAHGLCSIEANHAAELDFLCSMLISMKDDKFGVWTEQLLGGYIYWLAVT